MATDWVTSLPLPKTRMDTCGSRDRKQNAFTAMTVTG